MPGTKRVESNLLSMQIKTAAFVISNSDVSKCPNPDKPEYAFIGRSNVGKSSLINMLTNHGSLAKISGRPGKTQLINHFIINEQSNPWYLVDLPGYGFAKASKNMRNTWSGFIKNYLRTRANLMCVMVLLDIRLKAQEIDLAFMESLGVEGIPFVMVFTKGDKLSPTKRKAHLEAYMNTMRASWEELPEVFVTSASDGLGKEELLTFIENTNLIY